MKTILPWNRMTIVSDQIWTPLYFHMSPQLKKAWGWISPFAVWVSSSIFFFILLCALGGWPTWSESVHFLALWISTGFGTNQLDASLKSRSHSCYEASPPSLSASRLEMSTADPCNQPQESVPSFGDSQQPDHTFVNHSLVNFSIYQVNVPFVSPSNADRYKL